MTDYRSNPLNQAANEIYLVIRKASAAGYQVRLNRGWAINLVDPETGESTPLWALADGEESS